MRPVLALLAAPVSLALAACPTPTPPDKPADKPVAPAATPEPTPPAVAEATKPDPNIPLPNERHFKSLRQLTFGGENAEAYFSSDDTRLVFQSTRDGAACDQIYTMNLVDGATQRVSSGKGRTTCAYFMPGDQRVLYASTVAAADDCLPAPDRSHGYVWKLYNEFDIYTDSVAGGDLQPLVTGPGYDAEATVSPLGDAIVFTSTRDGDPELYKINIDGSGLTRLTTTRGYDGGAFFSADGKRIVYRANHPEGPEELAAYDAIIKDNLVRPTRLEIFVMNADGSDQQQVTRNGKANFAPYFHPDGKRIIFSSNQSDPIGRNFDLYLIGDDGENQQQVTFSDTFDGFPMFSRDGKQLVFASNRGAKTPGDTDVFLAEWTE